MKQESLPKEPIEIKTDTFTLVSDLFTSVVQHLQKCGKVVSLKLNAVSRTTEDIAAGTKIATIPNGYRPSFISYSVGDASLGFFGAIAYPNGDLKLSSLNGKISKNNWVELTMTWIVD